MQEAQPGQREQIVDLLDLLAVGHDERRQPARCDDRGAVAELAVDAAQDRVDRAGVAEDDAGVDGVDRVFADRRRAVA